MYCEDEMRKHIIASIKEALNQCSVKWICGFVFCFFNFFYLFTEFVIILLLFYVLARRHLGSTP